MILPLSPRLHPTLGALGRMSLHLSSTCLSHLSATLGALGRMSLQFTLVSHTRLPHLSFTLVSHSGCLGRMSLHLSSICLPHLSPTLGALGRMSLHLSMRPKHPECETSVKDKCGRRVWETSVNCKLMRPKAPRVADKCERQVEDRCKLMRPKAPRVGDKCGRQMEDKCKLMRPKLPRVGDKCEGQVGDKCKLMRPKTPRVGDTCGRQVGNKCKLMRPKAPRVGNKCGRQVWETSVGDKWETSGRQVQHQHAAQSTQSGKQVEKQVRDKLKSHGPENPGASGGQVGNKSYNYTRPRAPRVYWRQEDEARQVGDKRETSVKPSCGTQSGETSWQTSGRQVKITWPRAPRVGTQVGQVGDTVQSHIAQSTFKGVRSPSQLGDLFGTS